MSPGPGFGDAHTKSLKFFCFFPLLLLFSFILFVDCCISIHTVARCFYLFSIIFQLKRSSGTVIVVSDEYETLENRTPEIESRRIDDSRRCFSERNHWTTTKTWPKEMCSLLSASSSFCPVRAIINQMGFSSSTFFFFIRFIFAPVDSLLVFRFFFFLDCRYFEFKLNWFWIEWTRR